MDDLNFVLFVSGPKQVCGHTLDLVLLQALPILNVQIHDALFADMPVLFEVTLASVAIDAAAHLCRAINPSSAESFFLLLLLLLLHRTVLLLHSTLDLMSVLKIRQT